MPSIITSPRSGIVPIACSTIARRIGGAYLRKASIIRLSGFLSSGSPARRRILFNTFWQWWRPCSVSMYRTVRLSSGNDERYFSTVPFFNADAAMAVTLKVFLLLALPIEALKFPSVPIAASSTINTTGDCS